MKKILICDDDATVRLLLRVVLANEYEFSEASDGAAAIKLARRVEPDLVLLDIMLPRRNGIDVLEELRRDPRLHDVPMVVISASPEQQDAAFAAGADRFFAKPFEPDELTSVVEELLAAR